MIRFLHRGIRSVERDSHTLKSSLHNINHPHGPTPCFWDSSRCFQWHRWFRFVNLPVQVFSIFFQLVLSADGLLLSALTSCAQITFWRAALFKMGMQIPRHKLMLLMFYSIQVQVQISPLPRGALLEQPGLCLLACSPQLLYVGLLFLLPSCILSVSPQTLCSYKQIL